MPYWSTDAAPEFLVNTESGAYLVSKFALNALGELMQMENQELGIRVSTLCPGMVLTEMAPDAPGLNHDHCLYPQDVADLALFLLTRRPNVKIGRPVLIQTMLNPWTESDAAEFEQPLAAQRPIDDELWNIPDSARYVGLGRLQARS